MLFMCADLAKNLLELQEGRASSFERAAMRLHLSICERCRRYVAQLDEMRQALARLAPDSPAAAGASLTNALASFRAAAAPGSAPQGPSDDEDLP
jgi:anti-sigma factor RsiW